MPEDLLNLLIIDDDEVDRMTIQRSLAKANIPANIDMAEKGLLGLAMLKDKQYDCLFIDYVLPDINGVALLKEIRAQGITTPIVMVTSHGDERVAIEAIRNGASDYISKNLLTPEGVSHSIRTALKVFEAEKEKKAAEMALLQSESQLKEAQKLAKLGNWELDFKKKD